VNDVVWLASYPKSGNTWFRILVANLSAKDGPVDINDLPVRGGIASARGDFEFVTLVDSGLLTHDEADALRPRVYEALASDEETTGGEGPGPRFIKVHDAYAGTPLGEPLLAGARGARGAILIVRDPRDVAPSLANHRHITVERAVDFMHDEKAAFAGESRSQSHQLRQRLFSWSGHGASWLDQTDLPVHLVRYEDLAADTLETFRAAMDFAGQPVSRADAERAIDFASFERLQAQERGQGFSEWRGRGDGRLFFRRGQTSGWREELTPEQVGRIEAAHGWMMDRLGYERAVRHNDPISGPSREEAHDQET
jgi:aryl sulfotransferase